MKYLVLIIGLIGHFTVAGQQRSVAKKDVAKTEGYSVTTVESPPYKGDVALNRVILGILDNAEEHPLRPLAICDSLLGVYPGDELIEIYKVNAITMLPDKAVRIQKFVDFAGEESNPTVLSTIINRLNFIDESGFSAYCKEAESIATKLITLRGNGDDYYIRGEIETDLEQFDAALLDYNQALSLPFSRPHWEVRQSIAFLYKTTGKYFEAIQMFNQIVDVADMGRNVLFNRGLCKKELHDYVGAMADFDLALNTRNRFANGAPYREEIVLEKARLHLRLKKYNVAETELLSVLKTTGPGNDGFKAGVYNLLGIARYNLKQKAMACTNWSKAGGLGSREAYNNINLFCK